MSYTDSVRAYIQNTISAERYGHTCRTEELTLSLAGRFDLQSETACAAALWHDIARGWSDARLLAFVTERGLETLPYELENPMLLHGLVGAELFSTWEVDPPFSEEDSRSVWEAIRWHTTGHAGMGPLGYCLFIADYAEAGRTHLSDEQKEMILSLPTLKEMVRTIMEMQIAYFASKGVHDIGPGRGLYEEVCRECGS